MEKLEKILEEINLLDIIYDVDNGGCLLRHEDVEKIIQRHMNDDWIPVEERLPEVDADIEETIEDDDCPEYLVTIRGASESTVLKYSPDGAWFDENGYVYDVIAWRPLPEPYRPERSEVE